MLEDVFGNTFTYSGLGSVSELYPAARAESRRRSRAGAATAPAPKPDQPASGPACRSTPTPAAARRSACSPTRPRHAAPRGEVFRRTVTSVFGVNTKSEDVTLRPLEPGARVVAGTVLGRVGKAEADVAPHLNFAIRPAGRGAPQIDPKPILDGWKLLETTAIYRAAGRQPVLGRRRRRSARSC